MSPTRRFPFDEPATGPLCTQPERAMTAGSEASRWPLLARIPEVNRSSAEHATPPASPARTTYRIDAPHAELAPAKTSPLQPVATAVETPARTEPHSPPHATPASELKQDRILRAAPLPIRIALEATEWIQPHQKLLRLAAMITLMSAGSMAMVMMMNERIQPAAPPAAPATTAVDTPAVPELEIQHAELDRALVPTIGPAAEIDVDTLEPTAAGPLPPQSEPLMAVEREEILPTLPYPSTLRPEPLERVFVDDSLPHAQFNEPAVARLKGTVEETEVR